MQNMETKNVEPILTILHFNDVYDIQPNKKGSGGIVNFEAYIRKLRTQYPKNILLFSGDCLSPSILSNIYEGKQMVKSLNKLGIDIACYGNHQFDFHPEITQQLATDCSFPWLLGNIKYKDSEFCLGNGIPYLIKEYYGLKIGFFGVAGQDWLGILVDDYEDQLEYQDAGLYSQKMCKLLIQQQKCDMVIALTHMRVPQDERLPLQAPQIDLILGGHDHIIFKQFINGIPVLKSGDNFKTIGIIDVFKKETNPQAQYKCKNFDYNIRISQIPIAQENIDQELKTLVEECMNEYNKNDCILGYTDVDLDTRFSQVRTKQTNYGNFMADLARLYYDSDCCIINSGAIRNDALIKAGPLTYSMVSNIINDNLVVKKVPGKLLFQALEYGCSNLPNTYSGSFLLVSGIKFTYDYRKNPRIQSIEVAGAPLEPQRIYTVASKSYISAGGDGFTMLRDCPFLVDQVTAIETLNLLLKFFNGAEEDDLGRGHIDSSSSVEPPKMQQRKSSLEQSAQNIGELPKQPTPILLKKQTSILSKLPSFQNLKLQRKVSKRMSRIFNLAKTVVQQEGKHYAVISPNVQGRIISLYP